MHVDVIETPDLGDRSYVVSDGTCAVVVDPQRDLDRVESLPETPAASTIWPPFSATDYVQGTEAMTVELFRSAGDD